MKPSFRIYKIHLCWFLVTLKIWLIHVVLLLKIWSVIYLFILKAPCLYLWLCRYPNWILRFHQRHSVVVCQRYFWCIFQQFTCSFPTPSIDGSECYFFVGFSVISFVSEYLNTCLRFVLHILDKWIIDID